MGSERSPEGSGRVGNQKTNRNHPNYSIAKIGQNTERSPGNLRRLAGTDHSKRPSANAGVNKNLQGVIPANHRIKLKECEKKDKNVKRRIRIRTLLGN